MAPSIAPQAQVFISALKYLARRFRYVWTLVLRCLRYLQQWMSFRGKHRRSGANFPPPASRTPRPNESDAGGGLEEMRTDGERPSTITASYLPSHTSYSIRQSPSALSHHGTLSSSDIEVNVLPPEDSPQPFDRSFLAPPSGTVSPSARSSISLGGASVSSGVSSTLSVHTPNTMSSQNLHLTRALDGSQTAFVLPASSSLLPADGDVLALVSASPSCRVSIVGFESHSQIHPLLPSKIPRYTRERTVGKNTIRCELSAYQNSFRLDALPDGWEQLVQPEGQPYFYNRSKRIVTESWMWDESICQPLLEFITKFEDFTRSRDLFQPNDAHLMLDVTIRDGEARCGYYYASASTRSLFWLQPHDISHHLHIRGEVLSASHIKMWLEYQYWCHWDIFPHVNSATSETYELLLNTLADARTDLITSFSAAVYESPEKLREMTEIVKGAMELRNSNSNSHWCIGRFMMRFADDRFLNYYGQYGARLNSMQSIHDTEKRKETWLIRIISPLLFAAPKVHLKSLTELRVDELTVRVRCLKFFVKLTTQWGEHIVHASILLNANVAFLAIPSNDPSNNSGVILPYRTSAQIVSYLSIVTSFASMLLALMLVRAHKSEVRDDWDMDEYRTYLERHCDLKRGFEGLAILYSLPYALLTWGMWTFLIAFMLMCVVRAETPTRSIVASSAGLVCVLIIWCIWTFWDKSKPEDGTPDEGTQDGTEGGEETQDDLPTARSTERSRRKQIISWFSDISQWAQPKRTTAMDDQTSV